MVSGGVGGRGKQGKGRGMREGACGWERVKRGGSRVRGDGGRGDGYRGK